MFGRTQKSKMKLKIEESFISNDKIEYFRDQDQSQIPMAAGCINMAIYFSERLIKSKNSFSLQKMNPDIPAFYISNFIFGYYRQIIRDAIESRNFVFEKAYNYQNFVLESQNLIPVIYKNEYRIVSKFSDSLINRYYGSQTSSKLIRDIRAIPEGTSDFEFDPVSESTKKFTNELASVMSFESEIVPLFIEKVQHLSKLVGWDFHFHIWPARN